MPEKKPGKCEIKQIVRRIIYFSVGMFIGFLFSLIFEPFLHFLLYRSMTYMLCVIAYAIAIICTVFFIYLETRSSIRFSRQRAFELFFLGVSAMSFVLTGINFVTYPNMLFSSGSSWITHGRDWIFGDGVHLSSIVFFIAKTLWSIFIGSLFAVLNRLLTILSKY